MKKNNLLAVGDYTFSRIKTSNHHTFSRITPCIPREILHPSIKYPTKILSLLTTESAKRLHTKEAKQRLWIHRKHEKAQNSSVQDIAKLKPLFHHRFSVETRSKVTRTQNLNYRPAKR